MRRIVILPLLLLALLAAAPLAVADETEEAGESALVEDAIEGCEVDLLCGEEPDAEEAEGGEGEAEDESGDEAEATHTRECLLRSARGHAVLKNDKLKITIGYTTREPVQATVQLRYGARALGSLKRHLGVSGVLRFTKKLKGGQGDKRSRLRIRLATEGAGCPSRRLALFPKS
ncbi:MAG TPA: hypothetical protein VGB06_05070 [Solirubrobacterales bacterium]|jgi:hypothetical protein